MAIIVTGIKNRNLKITRTRLVEKTDFQDNVCEFLEVTTLDTNADRKKGREEVRLISFKDLDALQAAREGDHVGEENVESLDQDEAGAAE